MLDAMAFSLARLPFVLARHGTVSDAIHIALLTARRHGDAPMATLSLLSIWKQVQGVRIHQ
jgi:hypothetical protein